MKQRTIIRAAVVLFPLGLLVAVAAGAAIQSLTWKPDLPVLYTVTPFELQERSGQTVGLDDLKGKIWIADFIFTSCAGICPTMTSQMRKLQDALADEGKDILLVSITVDPDRDTLKRLNEYAEGIDAGKNWLFLRGPIEKVRELSQKGFRLGLPPPSAEPPEPGTEPIAHDRHFVLVDREGRIRGYYDALAEPSVVGPLTRDALALETRASQ